MEIENLAPIILTLVLVGLVVGVGVLTLDKFGTATKELRTTTSESITIPAQNAIVTLANGNLTKVTSIVNSTGTTLSSANYSINLVTGAINNTDNVSSCGTGDTCLVTYSWTDYNTKTNAAVGAAGAAVGDVSNTWMSLIVTLLALSLILGLMVTSFVMGRK